MKAIFVCCLFSALSVLSLGADTPCTSGGGTCQEDSLSCSGHYQSGLCSGSASRRCCLPATSSTSLDCAGFSNCHHARGTAYYPDSSALEGGYVDMRGAALHTLQDYLEGKASYVSVAMDNRAGIAYGTRLCIREMNHKYNRVIPFAVVDTGGAFTGQGYSRIDICVRSASYSYDATINGGLTLCFH
ncbi:uncharacterized protein LOC112564393 [Pomacea canaliculata]|uniref:uncharacterized protein LOC112564393 n=1 Tax=Pomacea canaliculata TaxID=400727 RepID=UPI000D7300BC|nr:uncharacterized protein LOC112564393 [Pomacea canaliculata]